MPLTPNRESICPRGPHVIVELRIGAERHVGEVELGGSHRPESRRGAWRARAANSRAPTRARAAGRGDRGRSRRTSTGASGRARPLGTRRPGSTSGASPGVSRVASGRIVRDRRQRRRRDVVGASPEHVLLVAVLKTRLLLALPLQVAVVPLVQRARCGSRESTRVRRPRARARSCGSLVRGLRCGRGPEGGRSSRAARLS